MIKKKKLLNVFIPKLLKMPKIKNKRKKCEKFRQTFNRIQNY